ncbi:SGNH/GDSL hydrolase family protein [Acidobacteriota bacterium]
MRLAAYITMVILSLSLVLNAMAVFRFIWIKRTSFRATAMRVSLSVFTLLFSFLAVEGAFRFFVVQSDAWWFTLSCKEWFRRHWKPVNSFGFRDVEHSKASLTGQKIVIVLGDSFVTGYGIENCSDRYSNILQDHLGEGWTVINMARNGWSTAEELQALESFPFPIEHIILSHFINDIEPVTYRLPHYSREQFQSPIEERIPTLLEPFVENFHSINYVYWRLYRFRDSYMTMTYKDYLIALWSDPEVWLLHAIQLRQVAWSARERHAELTVLAFPHLRDIEGTSFIPNKVAKLYRAEGVKCVNFGELLKGREAMSLVVNSVDSHPNKKLHREIADILMRQVFVTRHGHPSLGKSPSSVDPKQQATR